MQALMLRNIDSISKYLEGSNPIVNRAIGGVFALEGQASQGQAKPPVGPSILKRWSTSAAAVYCFHNARSCLHYTLTDLKIRRLWLPAYLCPEILQSTRSASVTVLYYPVTASLSPDIEKLSKKLQPDDVILTINFFGRAPSVTWLDFIATKPDILWIEDCAQVIDSDPIFTSDIRIYSPRKILGVPDGGILIDRKKRLRKPALSPLNDDYFMLPYQMRANDKEDKKNQAWFKAFQKSERSQKVSMAKMSGFSNEILNHIPMQPLASARRENYAILLDSLKEWAFFLDVPDEWIPFCFPITSDKAGQLCAELSRNRIFPPRYWLDLPSPKARFPIEHDLSRRLVGLPCDQRYDSNDMERMISLVHKFYP